MLQVHDIRESRVYQEAKEEGLREGMEKGREEGLEKGARIARLAAASMPAVEIARILGVDIEVVRRVIEGSNGD